MVLTCDRPVPDESLAQLRADDGIFDLHLVNL